MSFIYCYCDATTSKIIDIVEDRKLNNLRKYFAKFPFKARANVKNIVIDMYPPYISLIKSMFPNAKISIDRFHLVQFTSRSFNKLKSFWRLLLKNSCDLSSKKTRRNKMFDYHFLFEEDIVKLILSYDKTLEIYIKKF